MSEPKDKSYSFGSKEYPLKVSFSEFKGRKFLDLRKWYLDKKSNEIKPTKKGISLSHTQFQSIFEFLIDEKKSIIDWLSKPTSNEEFFKNLEKKSQLIHKQSEEAKKFKTKKESLKDSAFFKIEYKDNEKYLVFNNNHELAKALEKEIKSNPSYYKNIIEDLLISFKQAIDAFDSEQEIKAQEMEDILIQNWSVILRNYLKKRDSNAK
jgi:hypothetical protein|tara:strand:- start:1857 stop:2480 length:624 start_codon:yes stop_codon:yes gene_type:complete